VAGRIAIRPYGWAETSFASTLDAGKCAQAAGNPRRIRKNKVFVGADGNPPVANPRGFAVYA
jgi:hypothetical protein